MKYIYCKSSYGLFLAMYLRNEGMEFTLITGKKLVPVVESLNIKYELTTFRFGLRERLLWIVGVRPLFFKKLKNSFFSIELYATHTQYADEFFYLCKYLKNAKRIIYNIEPSAELDKGFLKGLLRPSTVFTYLNRILDHLNGVPTKVAYYSDSFYLKLNIEKALAKKVITDAKLNPPIEEITLGALEGTLAKGFGGFCWLYVASVEFDHSWNLYAKHSIKLIIDLIESRKIPVKGHVGGYSLPESVTLINWSGPVEFLFDSHIKCVIGISSTALINASWYFENKSCMVISLAELIEWKDESMKINMITRMKSRGTKKLLFPKSKIELDLLLNNVC